MPLRTLFVDMNSYFASVEQQVRPELRGRPVAVAPLRAESTCCIAASPEAKRWGIKTGTRVGEARRMCRGLVVVEARPEVYIRMHQRIVAAVEACYPVEAVLSIDEMCCRLTGRHQAEADAVALAREIKQSIRDRAGESLRCSIGLAPNRLLAKLASDLQKPDGLTVLRQEDLPERMFSIPLRDLCGIGPRMEARLRRAGIHNMEQLYGLTPHQLGEIWGSQLLGDHWWRRLRGEDVPETPTHRSSIGHSRVLAPELRHPAAARKMLERLLCKAATRLRREGYWATRLLVSVRGLDRQGWQVEARFPACQDTFTLLRAMRRLQFPREIQTPLKVGVVLYKLTAEGCTPRSLFEEDNRLRQLSQTLDQIQLKFGRGAVEFATLRDADPLPNRIAFTRIPELEDEEDDLGDD